MMDTCQRFHADEEVYAEEINIGGEMETSAILIRRDDTTQRLEWVAKDCFDLAHKMALELRKENKRLKAENIQIAKGETMAEEAFLTPVQQKILQETIQLAKRATMLSVNGQSPPEALFGSIVGRLLALEETIDSVQYRGHGYRVEEVES